MRQHETKREGGTGCGHCGMDYVPDGYWPDPCLGFLDDVAHACCGHGRTDRLGPYVVGAPDAIPGQAAYEVAGMPGSFLLRGQAALAYFEGEGVGPSRATA